MQRIAFYTRISTDEDHQKYSLGAQKERLEAFSKSQYGDEWTLFKLYRDTESGTRLDRPGLEEMLFDAQSQAFDTLLVFRVDRLSRKVRDLAQIVDELTKHDVALKSITEPFDTANAAGKMMLQMLGVFAEFEHSTIVERTIVGMEKKAKTGKWVGGTIPYGYSLDPELGLVINEEEAAAVRKMFKLYAVKKDGSQAITDTLNASGDRKRSGKKWDKRVILHMLKNPLYVGKIRWKDCIYEGSHKPITSQVLFDKAQEILQERAEESKGHQWHNRDARLLTGTIRCASCKSRMFGAGAQRNGKYMPYYVCSKRYNTHDCSQDYIRADSLESLVIDDIKAIFRDEAFLAKVWKETNRRLMAEKPDLDSEIKRIDAQLSKTQAKLDRYFDAFEAGTMKPALCSQKVENLTAILEQLESEKKELEARRNRLELPILDKGMLDDLVGNFEKVLAEGSKAQQKHLMQQLVKKVVVHDRKKVEVWYSVPDSQRFAHWNNWLPVLTQVRIGFSKQLSLLV